MTLSFQAVKDGLISQEEAVKLMMVAEFRAQDEEAEWEPVCIYYLILLSKSYGSLRFDHV